MKFTTLALAAAAVASVVAAPVAVDSHAVEERGFGKFPSMSEEGPNAKRGFGKFPSMSEEGPSAKRSVEERGFGKFPSMSEEGPSAKRS
ncbi:uncharacterized protein JCM10292_000711, partial [Rhodotorula paludigena]|uniref:uncharacterized protein n=1 Tax=Rhodotorula paludigena TaxID=86838 RepID=UPI0031756FF2